MHIKLKCVCGSELEVDDPKEIRMNDPRDPSVWTYQCELQLSMWHERHNDCLIICSPHMRVPEPKNEPDEQGRLGVTIRAVPTGDMTPEDVIERLRVAVGEGVTLESYPDGYQIRPIQENADCPGWGL